MTTEQSRPIERLAGALQDCLDEAARKGAQEAMDRIEPRLDKQDATLRLMWKQMKGNGRLPIDDRGEPSPWGRATP